MLDELKTKNKLRLWLERNPSLTLRRFASAVGCTPSYISQLARETGAPWPSRPIAVRIAQVTQGEVTPNDLAGLFVTVRGPSSVGD